MAERISERMAADIEGDFVVFLIGAKVYKPWKVWEWGRLLKGMNPMLAELERNSGNGFLGYERFGFLNGVIVQYWRSFEDLERYARDREGQHYPAWAAFNRYVKDRGKSDSCGIWHETFLVPAGKYEAIYHGTRPLGLGKVGALAPATGRRATAARRAGVDPEREYPEGIAVH